MAMKHLGNDLIIEVWEYQKVYRSELYIIVFILTAGARFLRETGLKLTFCLSAKCA